VTVIGTISETSPGKSFCGRALPRVQRLVVKSKAALPNDDSGPMRLLSRNLSVHSRGKNRTVRVSCDPLSPVDQDLEGLTGVLVNLCEDQEPLAIPGDHKWGQRRAGWNLR
jgi:hypothetical protein